MYVDTCAARIARLANNGNVLALSMRYTGEPLGNEIVDEWLATAPSIGPRRVEFHCKTEGLDRPYLGPSADKTNPVESAR